MEPPNPSSFRVLIRPPSTSASASASASAAVIATPNSSPRGVVVVGFLGSKPTIDVAHLINRILDADVFGSGGLDKELLSSAPDARSIGAEWFRRRRISYYHDAEKGMVFVHFSCSSNPGVEDEGFDSAAEEESEADDLRGMLLMFSVCHAIVFLHEGLRFDTQILKKFRMLQAAKHALAPFIRSQVTPASMSKSSLSVSQPTAAGTSSVSQQSGVTSRHPSAISLMSGSGSHPSVLPGQCTPVILFAFDDEFLDGWSPPTDDMTGPSSTNQSSNLGGTRTGLTLKGSGSVVMLARPMSKMEGSFKKKLHSSLEAQVRFLIKKCRILVTNEPSHLGSRVVLNVSSLPLFSLDASRVVALIDRSMNQRSEPLDFVTGVIEEALNSKKALDMSVLENHCATLNNDDIQSIKDFIYRQSDTLRGRGGLSSNQNSGPGGGVGMVAAAAAAAAASAAAGKPQSAPELPSLENWLFSTNLILDALLSVNRCFVNETGSMKRLAFEGIDSEIPNEKISPPRVNVLEAAVSCLESSKGLTLRFSISWCQRAFPAAMEIYMKELPACYPTALHKAQLEKALHAFRSMVKGPAVNMFAKKLVDECLSIWESGRQLCDSVSLTGKPCMHTVHSAETKQHSSGYFFLHACACGRSRHLRDDPFDFGSANITYNHFENCENLLPTLVLPKGSSAGPLPSSAWSLVRLGGARYYKPSKGLLQIGFCNDEKFLFKWSILLEKWNGASGLSTGDITKSNITISTLDPKALSDANEQWKKPDASQFQSVQPIESENQRKSSAKASTDDTSISFGKGLPSFTMKKPYSEVVAGTIVADSTFPILQHRKPPKTAPSKVVKQMGAGETDNRVHLADNLQGSQKTEQVFVRESSRKLGSNCSVDGDPFLQIGSNIVPVNLGGSGKIKPNSSLKQVILYVGFEHECPHGHRFLLSPDHLKELDSSFSLSENSHSSTEDSERKNSGNNYVLHEKILPYSLEPISAVNNIKRSKRSTETSSNSSQQHDLSTLFSRSGIEKQQPGHDCSMPSDFMEELQRNLVHVRLDDGGCAVSLLNRNLPVYMNCPHCKCSIKQENQNIKFASTVSQLQRIFLVTPPFPTVLATCPVIQFEGSCLPLTILDRKQQSRFSIGCRVILPPESFLTCRLPFVYCLPMDDGSLQPLKPHEHQPELTAWLVKGTTLQVVSFGREIDKEFHIQ